jgi:hypothetical protein
MVSEESFFLCSLRACTHTVLLEATVKFWHMMSGTKDSSEVLCLCFWEYAQQENWEGQESQESRRVQGVTPESSWFWWARLNVCVFASGVFAFISFEWKTWNIMLRSQVPFDTFLILSSMTVCVCACAFMCNFPVEGINNFYKLLF